MDIGFDPDFLLIQKMRLGEEKALEHFVEKYYSSILKYCQIHIRDQGYAEDMAQETFARFFKSLKQYRHYGKAANYLYTIAANVCRDYHRQKQEIPVEDLPESPPVTGDIPLGNLAVQDALHRLSPELRETAVLFFLQERKQKDIAKILGIGLPLVKYRIRRSRELLSAYFREEEL